MAQSKTKNKTDFQKKYMSKPVEPPRCMDCAYCNRGAYMSGKWPCRNPDVHVGVPVDHSKPCFVRRGSKEAHDRGL